MWVQSVHPFFHCKVNICIGSPICLFRYTYRLEFEGFETTDRNTHRPGVVLSARVMTSCCSTAATGGEKYARERASVNKGVQMWALRRVKMEKRGLRSKLFLSGVFLGVWITGAFVTPPATSDLGGLSGRHGSPGRGHGRHGGDVLQEQELGTSPEVEWWLEFKKALLSFSFFFFLSKVNVNVYPVDFTH